MKALIDTHVLLWWLEDPGLISPKARKIIENARNFVFYSSAVIWEIILKQSIGKLKIPNEFYGLLDGQNFTPLSINIEHAFALKDLPGLHSDPFDRIMVAQALYENMVLLTRDRNILKYDIQTIKA